MYQVALALQPSLPEFVAMRGSINPCFIQSHAQAMSTVRKHNLRVTKAGLLARVISGHCYLETDVLLGK